MKPVKCLVYDDIPLISPLFMGCWKTNLSLYKLPVDRLGKEPKGQEELFIPLMQTHTQHDPDIKRGQHC